MLLWRLQSEKPIVNNGSYPPAGRSVVSKQRILLVGVPTASSIETSLPSIIRLNDLQHGARTTNPPGRMRSISLRVNLGVDQNYIMKGKCGKLCGESTLKRMKELNVLQYLSCPLSICREDVAISCYFHDGFDSFWLGSFIWIRQLAYNQWLDETWRA